MTSEAKFATKPDIVEATAFPGGDEIVTDRVLYNLQHRGIEWVLMPWCFERGIPIMAYSPIEHSPIEQRGMLDHPTLKMIAARHGATPAQLALAWLFQREGIIAIPKASNPVHVRENRQALDLRLTTQDLMEIERDFPPPRWKVPLAMR